MSATDNALRGNLHACGWYRSIPDRSDAAFPRSIIDLCSKIPRRSGFGAHIGFFGHVYEGETLGAAVLGVDTDEEPH